MTNILTATQASNALRTTTDDPRMLDLLPQIDKFVERATGRDWTQDASIHATAVSAATMLLVMWFENPAMIGDGTLMVFGLTSAFTILEAEALKYRKYEFEGVSGIGWINLPGAREGDVVIKLVGTYGASGSQIAKFESAIAEENYIQQISTDDLSEKHYVVVLKNPADEVGV